MNILSTKIHKKLCSGLTIMLAWSAAPSVAALNFTEFTGLGFLPRDGPIREPFGADTVLKASYANDVSADGSVIVGDNWSLIQGES